VGKDQEQNMEMARLFARRFNRIYNVEYFKEPASFHFADKAVKVPGLDGTGKMGKSEGNCLYLCDDEKTVTKKIMRAVTDQGPTQLNQEKPEVIQNLFTLCELLCGKDAAEYYNDLYNRMEIRYGDMKKQMAADANTLLAPIRERILAFSSDDAYLERVMRQGAEAAAARAEKTIEEVREIIGFRKI
jgi:tryptophanyl-tRNA synthetase